ncbi:MAG: hypothetical protein ACPGYT_14560 [Nitrospirales bacterium]
MFSHHLSHLFFCTLIFLYSLILVTSLAHAEAIEGFRELKFGMTKKEVVALETCSTATECLYELAGKNRYLIPFYTQSPDSSSPPTVAKISIDMGAFNEPWFADLQIRLRDQYQLTHDLRSEDVEAFKNGHITQLTSGYEDGQVLLQVIRRKFGNLILKVIYQNKEMAAKTFLTPHTSSPQ